MTLVGQELAGRVPKIKQKQAVMRSSLPTLELRELHD